VGLKDNGGNRLGLGEGIIGLGEGVFLPGLPFPAAARAAFDFFLPKDSKWRRGLSSSVGRLKSGGWMFSSCLGSTKRRTSSDRDIFFGY